MSDIFDKLINELEQKISKNEFNKEQISNEEVHFVKNEVRFKVSYVNSNVILSSFDKKLCEWHFDDSSSNKDISEIVDDFCEFILGKGEKKQKQKRTDETVPNQEITFDTMIEKVLQFFPEERDEYAKNLSESTMKEKILFIKDRVVPKIDNMVKKSKCDNRVDRLFNHLANSYIFGDENTKCIVTMMFFNSITGNEERKKVRAMLPCYLRKTWDFSWKVK